MCLALGILRSDKAQGLLGSEVEKEDKRRKRRQTKRSGETKRKERLKREKKKVTKMITEGKGHEEEG